MVLLICKGEAKGAAEQVASSFAFSEILEVLDKQD